MGSGEWGLKYFTVPVNYLILEIQKNLYIIFYFFNQKRESPLPTPHNLYKSHFLI